MRRNILIFAFVAAVLMVLVGRLTTTAYGASAPARQDVRIESAGIAAAPKTVFFGNAHGSITPGDLYYIDLSDSANQTRCATIYITNADSLYRYLRYLILNIGVYVKNESGGWDKCPQANSPLLTLKNGSSDVILPCPGYFKITVDSGNYYSFANTDMGEMQAPIFNLEVGD